MVGADDNISGRNVYETKAMAARSAKTVRRGSSSLRKTLPKMAHHTGDRFVRKRAVATLVVAKERVKPVSVSADAKPVNNIL